MNLNKEQKRQYDEYDEEFGIDENVKTLFKIALKHDIIKEDERVEPILTMFGIENESLPHFKNENGIPILDINKIDSEPKVLRKIIDTNYEQYMINGYDFEL